LCCAEALAVAFPTAPLFPVSQQAPPHFRQIPAIPAPDLRLFGAELHWQGRQRPAIVADAAPGPRVNPCCKFPSTDADQRFQALPSGPANQGLSAIRKIR